MVEPEGARQRFQIEARASARLAGHPNIVTVYDYGEEEGSAYLVLQLVDGLTLDKRLTTPITAQEIDKIVTGVASALDFAHRNSLIHRDIKPSNVLLEQDGTAILSDFGIAKLLDATASMTNTLLGTPDYMSPEQITGSPLDARSDVYALGVMVYRIFAGKTPFQGAPMAILHQHVHSPVPPLPPNPLTGRPRPPWRKSSGGGSPSTPRSGRRRLGSWRPSCGKPSDRRFSLNRRTTPCASVMCSAPRGWPPNLSASIRAIRKAPRFSGRSLSSGHGSGSAHGWWHC